MTTKTSTASMVAGADADDYEVSPPYTIIHRDEYSTRVFFTGSDGRGLFVETACGYRQLVGTCDTGRFPSLSAFRSYVERRYSADEEGAE